MKKILAVLARGQARNDIHAVIIEAASKAGEQVGEEVRVQKSEDLRRQGESLHEHIMNSDIVIADTSGSPVDVMYELGFAHGQERPTILISEITCAPTLFDLQGVYKLLFDRPRMEQTLGPTLVAQIVDSLKQPGAFLISAATRGRHDSRPTVFVSYSHVDCDSLNRLRIHLSPIQRQSVIEYWDDTQLCAGDRWQDEIDKALKRARIAVLLISADFLASEFVVNNELPLLLRAAEEKGTLILPVILKACRFSRDPHLSVFQAVNDPRRPLLTLSETDQEAVWARIAERIESEFLPVE